MKKVITVVLFCTMFFCLFTSNTKGNFTNGRDVKMPTYQDVINKYKNGETLCIGIMGNSIGCGFRADNTFSPNPYNTAPYGLLAEGYDMTGGSPTLTGQYDTRIQSWAVQLYELLKSKNTNNTIQNMSGNGWSAVQHINANTVASLAARVPKPDAVIVPLQVNDAREGGTGCVALWQSNMRMIIQAIKANGMIPILMKESAIDPIDIYGINGINTYSGVAPARPYFYDLVNAVDAMAIEQSVGVIDVFSATYPLMQAAGIGNCVQSGYLWDYLHPNQHGHDLIFQNVKKFFEPITIPTPTLTLTNNTLTATATVTGPLATPQFYYSTDNVIFNPMPTAVDMGGGVWQSQLDITTIPTKHIIWAKATVTDSGTLYNSGITNPFVIRNIIITLSASATKIPPNQTLQINYTVTDTLNNPMDAANLIWSVDKPSLAIITQGGLFTALNTDGVVTVTLSDPYSFFNGQYQIGISTRAVSSIVISPDNVILQPKQTQQFASLTIDQYGVEIRTGLNWSVSDTTKASITQPGLFQHKNNGFGSITVTATDIATGIFNTTVVSLIPWNPTTPYSYELINQAGLLIAGQMQNNVYKNNYNNYGLFMAGELMAGDFSYKNLSVNFLTNLTNAATKYIQVNFQGNLVTKYTKDINMNITSNLTTKYTKYITTQVVCDIENIQKVITFLCKMNPNLNLTAEMVRNITISQDMKRNINFELELKRNINISNMIQRNITIVSNS